METVSPSSAGVGPCTGLRVEYAVAPDAVATARPRFSWIAPHAQDAFELEVHDDAARPMWRSGVVEGARAPLVAYAGEPLRSDTRYAWRVRSRSAAGWTQTAVATFRTALLSPADDWHAPWIEPRQDDARVERWSLLDWIRGLGPDAPPAERLRPVRLLRQTLDIPADIVDARLYATARGVYTAWLNGERVGDQVLAPGFDSYLHRTSVQSYDVTSSLRAGPNVLAVALADGWWAGSNGLTGSTAQFGTRTAATWQLHLRDRDGRTAVVVPDAQVRSATGGWAYADLFVGEQYDRRAEPVGWRSPGFDDGGWDAVTTADVDTATLVPFAGEPIRRVAELPPASLVDTADGVIVDFGQVIAGRVRLRLRDAAPGQRVVIEHTEALAPDGAWFQNIIGINKDQTDVYVAAGGGDEGWEPEFTFHGFRYARVRGLRGALAADDVVAVVIASDLEQTGVFESSDARLNRLHQNVVWSQRANFLSVPTDCPQRERAGWTGDAQVFAAAATNNALVAPFLERWLDNLRADQLPDGRIPITSPRSPFDADAAEKADGIGGIVAAAGWSDAIAIVPWTLYERYGDTRVLAENYPAVRRWIDHQRAIARAELPASCDPLTLSAERRAAQALLWNTGTQFGDWQTPSTMEGRPLHEAIGIAPRLTGELIGPMFQAHTLTLAARMAGVLGRDDDARAYATEAQAVRAAFSAEYVDAEGRLPVALQGVHVIALAFGMIPADRRAACAAYLAALVAERGDRLDTGFLSVPYLLDVLWDAGYQDLARTLLWQDRSPSWLYAVDHGATTIWESWEAVAPDGTVRPVSLNHYAFGCVDDWLYRRVAGIRPAAPGYAAVVVEPDLDCGLEWARAEVRTPHGPVRVHWRLAGDGATIDTHIPPGIRATLVVDGVPHTLPAGAATRQATR